MSRTTRRVSGAGSFFAVLLAGALGAVSGCGLPENAHSGDVTSSQAALTSTPSAAELTEPDSDNAARGISADPTTQYGCGGSRYLCIGRCQASGGLFVAGDRRTVGYGNCAQKVENICDSHRWGNVTLACWGE